MREILHIIYRTDKGTVLLLLVALSVLFGVYRLLFEKKRFNNRLVAVMLSASVIATFVPTVLNRVGQDNTVEIMLEPFRSLRLYFTTGYEEWLRVCVMNFALFFPLGCSLACFDDKAKIKPWHVVVLSCVLSIAIEILQHIFSLGVSEFDDVFNNTLGALMGFVLTRLFYTAFYKLKK